MCCREPPGVGDDHANRPRDIASSDYISSRDVVLLMMAHSERCAGPDRLSLFRGDAPSVGARAAPINKATDQGTPKRTLQDIAMAAMVRGIAIPSSRHGAFHPCQESGRLVLRPAPIKATRITSSIRCSKTWRCPKTAKAAFDQDSGTAKYPMATAMIGNDSGSDRKSKGSQAVRRTTPPMAIKAALIEPRAPVIQSETLAGRYPAERPPARM